MGKAKRMDMNKSRVDTSIAGSSGLRVFNGYLREEFLKDLQGQAGARRYREMRDNDPVIGAMFNALDFFFGQTAFPIVPAVAGENASEMVADFIRGVLDDMATPFPAMLSEFMTAPVFGHSEHAMQLKTRGGDSKDPTRRSRFNDGRIGFRRIALRKQETIFKWHFDDNDTDMPVAFEQNLERPPWFLKVDLDRCIHFRMKSDLNNPEGKSLLRNCHKPYTFICGLQEIEAISHERLGCGLPVLPVPATVLDPESDDNAVASSLLDALGQVRFGERSALLVPHDETETGQKSGYGKLRFERPEGAASDINRTIMRWETRMAMTLMMDWLILGHDSANGSRAMHVDKTSMFGKSMSWMGDLFCNTFTQQGINYLCRINGFPEGTWPKLTHGPIVPVSLSEFGTFIKDTIGAGALIPGPKIDAMVRQMADIPMEDHQEDSPG